MIATMACDEALANRIRELIASEGGYTEQKIVGSIGFMSDGQRAAVRDARARVKGWLRVDAESISTKRALEPWAMQTVAFARALPPKEKK